MTFYRARFLVLKHLNGSIYYVLSSFRREQCAGKYTVMADNEKADDQELSLKSGDMVQLVKEENDGQW